VVLELLAKRLPLGIGHSKEEHIEGSRRHSNRSHTVVQSPRTITISLVFELLRIVLTPI
jgi:hypothetical protein